MSDNLFACERRVWYSCVTYWIVTGHLLMYSLTLNRYELHFLSMLGALKPLFISPGY